MRKLKVTLKSETSSKGNHEYSNEIDSSNYKHIALILMDLKNHSIPIDKSISEYKKIDNSGLDFL